MNTSLAFATIACYLTGGLLIGLRLFGRPDQWRPARCVALGVSAAALVLHALLLWQSFSDAPGLNFSFFSAGALVAWMIAALLVLSALTKPIENLGIVVMPLAAIAVLLELKFPGTRLLPENAPWGLSLHILLSILAYAIFSLAAFQAILLAIQNYHLRHRHPGGFIRVLPPLQTMESVLFELIGVGFLLLSLSLISGLMFLENMFAQQLVHKTILSIIAWGIFGILLFGRLRSGWRGRTAILWTLNGFFLLMLSYFGSKLVIEIILNQ